MPQAPDARGGRRARMLRSVRMIALGGAAYGAVFGLWRGPAQCLYVAVKLPVLLLAVGACALLASTLLGAAMGARLGFRDTADALLVGLATTARVLLAMAPVSLVLVLGAAPDPDPAMVGMSADAPALQPSLVVAQRVLLWHVAVVAVAGLLGMMALRRFVATIIADPTIARRVFATWLGVQALAGCELSWLFRPFLGKPHLVESPWRSEALSGNFFQEALVLAESGLGVSAGVFVFYAAIGVIVALSVMLRSTAADASLEILPSALRLRLGQGEGSELTLPFSALRSAVAHREALHIEIEEPESLQRRAYVIATETRDAAERLRERLLHAVESLSPGPFRS